MQKYEKIRLGNALFLDRDGVLNKRIDGGYVCKPADLVLLPGVAEAIAILNKHYKYTIVVTNQQGISKGLMNEEELHNVHEKMCQEIAQAGGHIDAIYYCPALKESRSFMRKPNIGMALLAKKEHTEIDFRQSVMVGDAATDMMFGKRCKMQTVLVGEWPEIATQQPKLVDYAYPTLIDFAQAVEQQER